MNIRKPPQDLTLEEWKQVLDTNLTSAFVASQAAYPHLKRAGGGKIINIGSMMSIFGGSYLAPYAASKGGIVQLTKALAAAWAKDNIQVNAVLPGWIDTALTQRAREELDRPERARAVAHPGRPLGRARRPRRHRGVPLRAAPRTSSPAPRSRWTAAIPSWAEAPLEPLELSAPLAWRAGAASCAGATRRAASAATGSTAFWQYCACSASAPPRAPCRFLPRGLRASCAGAAPRILIAGGADYSMLAHAAAGIAASAASHRQFTIVDWCETPLDAQPLVCGARVGFGSRPSAATCSS